MATMAAQYGPMKKWKGLKKWYTSAIDDIRGTVLGNNVAAVEAEEKKAYSNLWKIKCDERQPCVGDWNWYFQRTILVEQEAI